MAQLQLYPPTISQGVIAAYGDVLKVPFIHNMAISNEQISGYQLKIMNFQNSSVITGSTGIRSDIVKDGKIEFDISELSLTVGMFYKIQIAYYKNDNVGVYSDMATLKYTAQPTISMQGLVSTKANLISFPTFIGVYTKPNNDKLENLASYIFNIYDSQGNLFLTSGERLYEITKSSSETETITLNDVPIDTDEEGNDISANIKISVEGRKTKISFEPNIVFPDNEEFSVEFKTKSINNLEMVTAPYRIFYIYGLNVDFNVTIVPIPDREKGVINLFVKSEKGSTSGKYIITRTSRETNWNVREKIAEVTLVLKQKIETFIYSDYSVKQGEIYKYAIQMKNDNNIVSAPKESEEIMADFEDMFLYDGKKQLAIKFNPEISSFKTVIGEQKTETLGSNYPFFFRAGKKGYKEFPIGGLISYHMDNDFCDLKGLGLDQNEKIQSTNLVAYNIAAERKFREKVLNWLNDGRPKVFRSPTEGNYIVRISDVNLTPNTTVARMLYTFSANAVEIAEYNYSNYLNQGFSSIVTEDVYGTEFKSIALTTKEFESNKDGDERGGTIYYPNGIKSFRISNGLEGDKFYLIYSKKQSNIVTSNNDFETNSQIQNVPCIKLGKTGSYQVDKVDGLKQIIPDYNNNKFPQHTPFCQFVITSNQTKNTFNSIKTLSLDTEIAHPIIQTNESSNMVYPYTFYFYDPTSTSLDEYIYQGHLLQFLLNDNQSDRAKILLYYNDDTSNEIDITDIGSYEIRGKEQIGALIEIQVTSNIDVYFTYDKLIVNSRKDG